jgi:hypothetical protein
MAVGLVFNAPGVTESQYRQVLNQVSPDNQPAPGLLYHAAGASADGFCVIEVWESQAVVDRFFKEKLGAALQAAGITVQPTLFEVVNSMTV